MGQAEGKVAFVTGAARGLGRAHAVRLSAEGADIIAVDLCGPIASIGYQLGTLDDLAETASLVRAFGRRVLIRPADVRDLGQLESVVAEGTAAFGRLDIVVASARIRGSAPACGLSESAWQDVIDVNLTGAWLTCKAAVPHLIAGGRGGSVVLTGSAASPRPQPDRAPDVAAGHALAGLAKTLAQELAEHGIRVNVLSPSAGEASETRDATDALLFLVSDAARYLTSTVLSADAGALAR